MWWASCWRRRSGTRACPLPRPSSRCPPTSRTRRWVGGRAAWPWAVGGVVARHGWRGCWVEGAGRRGAARAFAGRRPPGAGPALLPAAPLRLERASVRPASRPILSHAEPGVPWLGSPAHPPTRTTLPPHPPMCSKRPPSLPARSRGWRPCASSGAPAPPAFRAGLPRQPAVLACCAGLRRAARVRFCAVLRCSLLPSSEPPPPLPLHRAGLLPARPSRLPTPGTWRLPAWPGRAQGAGGGGAGVRAERGGGPDGAGLRPGWVCVAAGRGTGPPRTVAGRLEQAHCPACACTAPIPLRRGARAARCPALRPPPVART